MAVYRRLATRFHCTPDDLADRLAATESKLERIDRDETDLRSLDQPLAEAWADLKRAAETITKAREKLAKDFARVIQAQLKPLGLGSSRLSVAVETRELGDDPLAQSPPDSGADQVEMLFSANPGEMPRPLRKIASGGELSRLTLAVKSVLAAVDRVPTLIFDEIDTGVGGRLGAALGKALAELSRHHQVICVTHLPQMASYADRHWVIRKRIERGRSRTTITPLNHHGAHRRARGHAPRRIGCRGNAPGGHRDARGSTGCPLRDRIDQSQRTTVGRAGVALVCHCLSQRPRTFCFSTRSITGPCDRTWPESPLEHVPSLQRRYRLRFGRAQLAANGRTPVRAAQHAHRARVAR